MPSFLVKRQSRSISGQKRARCKIYLDSSRSMSKEGGPTGVSLTSTEIG